MIRINRRGRVEVQLEGLLNQSEDFELSNVRELKGMKKNPTG
jgi:hypothetical protein